MIYPFIANSLRYVPCLQYLVYRRNYEKSRWAPILVIVPPSVIDNWKNEFETWGHFEVGTYQGGRREKALQKVKEGISEVLVVGKSLAMTYASKLMEIPWKLIVVDEVHAYKVC